MSLKTHWVSENSGKTYTVIRTGNSFVCNCPACYNGGMCREVQRLTGELEYQRLSKAFAESRTTKRPTQWFDEFPELILWDSSTRVIKTWQALDQYNYGVKCY